MKNFLLIIRQLLINAALFSWIDRDNGQLNSPPPSFPTPAAFFSIAVNSIATVTKNTQQWNVTVTIRMAWEMPAIETSGAAPDDAVQRSLQFYDTADAAWESLQGYADGTVLFFDLISQADESNKYGYSVIRQVYNCAFIRQKA